MWKVFFRYPSRISLYSRGEDRGHNPAAGIPGEGGGENLHLAGGKALVHSHGLEEPMEGGGGGDQDHGFVPSFLKKIVGVAQQLPGVALALHIGVGGQGVNIPHGDLCPVGKLDGTGSMAAMESTSPSSSTTRTWSMEQNFWKKIST